MRSTYPVGPPLAGFFPDPASRQKTQAFRPASVRLGSHVRQEHDLSETGGESQSQLPYGVVSYDAEALMFRYFSIRDCQCLSRTLRLLALPSGMGLGV